MAERTDEDIAIQVQRGDGQAFGILVERYESKMLRYARRFLFGYEDAEDTVQEAFLKAYVNIRSFDPKRKFSPWLYRIAHNEFINTIKRKRREPIPFFDPDVLFPHPHSRDHADRDVIANDLKTTLHSSLQRLPPKYREPLVLYYFEELDYREIAEILRIPASTVGVRLKRGRSALRKIYDTLNPTYGKT
ncbi:MAG: sigma-70 family RNA polymerase sigma factor [Patescibacteria group bacterium]|nr:sigma-70 family RNA polymerase sigma factor [Patescibacteria group bacterium]